MATFDVTATTSVSFFDKALAAGGAYIVSASSSFYITDRIVEGYPFTYVNPIRKSAAGSFNFTGVAVAVQSSVYDLTATTSFKFTDLAVATKSGSLNVTASTAVNFTDLAQVQAVRFYSVSAVTGVSFTDLATEAITTSYNVAATASFKFTDSAQATANRTINQTVSTTVRFTDLAVANIDKGRTAAATVSFAGLAVANVSRAVTATTGVNFAGVAVSGRVYNATATTGVNFAGVAVLGSRIYTASATTGVNFAGVASATKTGQTAAGTVQFTDLATASIILATGGGVPGGDTGSGLGVVLSSAISGDWPASYAECPNGLLLIADGVNPVIRWDGMSRTSDTAGVLAPTAAPLLGGMGVGMITGTRYAFLRYVDNRGNVSNLSPVSNGVIMGRDGLIDDITYDASGTVTIRSHQHGLLPGELIILSGILGLTQLNTTVTVATVVDADNFTLAGIKVVGGTWYGGGSWTWGVQTVVYSGLPTAAALETKVVRRQLLRNLEGTLDVLYVDIDTTDLTSTALSSVQSDEALSAGLGVPWAGPDNMPIANRYSPPPNHKSVLATCLGRVFAAVDVNYDTGCVLPVTGRTYLQGVGTYWPASLAGRVVYVVGASRPYPITSVDVANQRLILGVSYQEQTVPYAKYVVRSAPGERKLVYWSDTVSVEAWPEWNAFAVEENNDQLTGLMVMQSFLYVIERRHIHKFTFQQDPSTDGFLFPSVMRGCLNNRCWVIADDRAYMLDDTGIHSFDGSATEPISQEIQIMFQQDEVITDLQVDWTADVRLWHAAHDPVRYTIRWFLQMVDHVGTTHAIVYNYRNKVWWVEQYPYPITASTTGTVGYRRSLAGAPARRTVVLYEGTLDGVADSGTLRGVLTATSPGGITLTDANATFASNLGGASVTIVSGKGRGQTSIIASNTVTTLEVVTPFNPAPDQTSVYQIGGVSWMWQSNWFEYDSTTEHDQPRDIGVVYQPLVNGPGSLDVRIYLDYGDSPVVWGYTQEKDGVSTVSGSPYINMDLQKRAYRSGFSGQRLSGGMDPNSYADQFLSVVLSGVQPAEIVRIYSLALKGITDEQVR